MFCFRMCVCVFVDSACMIYDVSRSRYILTHYFRVDFSGDDVTVINTFCTRLVVLVVV